MHKSRNETEENVKNFANTAIKYCELIEKHSELDREKFLVEVNEILGLMYQQAISLPSVDIENINEDEEGEVVGNEEWKRLFLSLQNKLEDWVYYFDVFNPNNLEETEPVCSDLADDLADIYRDIKSGLRYWLKSTPDNQILAVWQWRFSFWSHSGQHITGAIRSIFWRLSDSYFD
jgi:hypothetical protein